MGSALRRASGTFGTESDEERPPSPGGSSIKSNPSKRKRRISIFKPDGKRTTGGPTRQNTTDPLVGTVDGVSHEGSLPVGDDSTTTTLPKPLEVSFADSPAPKEVHVEFLDSQPHQTSVEGASPALTTEQEEVMQFSVPQSEGAATQIGSETTIPQTQTATELKTADTALSSSIDMSASAFTIVSAMPEPEPAQGETGVQKSMER